MKPGKAKCGCVRDVRNVPLLSCTLYTLHPAITSFRRRPCKIGCLQGRGTLLDQKGIKLGPSTALEFLEGRLQGTYRLIGTGVVMTANASAMAIRRVPRGMAGPASPS